MFQAWSAAARRPVRERAAGEEFRAGISPDGASSRPRGACTEGARPAIRDEKGTFVSIEENKAVVGRWFTEFWGKQFTPAIIDELAAPDIRLEYSLHAPLRGRDAVRAFAQKFRPRSRPELLGHRRPDRRTRLRRRPAGRRRHPDRDAFDDMPYGPLPAGTGKVMRFTGTTVLTVGERPHHRGDRPRRRRHRAAPARPHHQGLTPAITVKGHLAHRMKSAWVQRGESGG